MLRLHYHPLASYCWKPLIALYESGVPFETVEVNIGDSASREAFAKVWPMLRFPVIEDVARGRLIAESSAIIEYLAVFHPGSASMLPADADAAVEARMWDRVCDSYLQGPMQAIVGNVLRPETARDVFGVQQARAMLAQAYDLIELRMAKRRFLAGESMTLADCSAAPGLFYCDLLEPLRPRWPALSAYLDRLIERPSFQRVLVEAEPYFHFFPLEPKPKRFRSDA